MSLRREWAEQECIKLAKEQNESVKLIQEINTENYQCLPPQMEEDLNGMPAGYMHVCTYVPTKQRILKQTR